MAVRLTLDNPVITKELRGRMRGSRAYWLLFGYVLLLSLVLFFSYLAAYPSLSNGMTGGGAAGFTVGRIFFEILFVAQALLVALITPALTAGAISIEREQRTFELLQTTTLPARAIVLGKLISSVSFIVLLLTSSLPLLSLCFLLGGVSPGEVFFAYLLLVCDAFLFGAIGLAWSAYAANTATATALAYTTLFIFFIATFPLSLGAIQIASGSGGGTSGLGAINPIGATLGALNPERYFGWTLPAWIPGLLLNGTLGALLTLACINRLVDDPARRAAPLRLLTWGFCILLLFFADGTLFGAQGRFLTSRQQLLFMMGTAQAALLLFVPTLVTGAAGDWPQKRAALGTLFSAWTPRRIFGDATLPTGLPLALLLTASAGGLFFLALHLIPAAPGTFRQIIPAAATDAAVQAGLLLLAVTFGIAGLGFLLSAALGNRWSSLIILYITVLLAMLLPLFSYTPLSDYDARQAARSPGVNSLYLCPFLALYQLAAEVDPRADIVRESPYVVGMWGFYSVPLWETTAGLYLTLGALGYTAAFAVLRRRKPVAL